MLQSFYENFGFLGTLFLAVFMFIFFIFWMAGMAGITLPYDGGRKRGHYWQIVLAVFIPVYPVLWLIYDMYLQNKQMTQK